MIKPNSEFWDAFKQTAGALSVCEAMAIIQIAATATPGKYMCLGAHKGKDTLASTYSIPKGEIYYLVDPCFNPNEEGYFGIGEISSMTSKIQRVHKDLRTPVQLLGEYSYNVIWKYKPFTYLFWDSGEHGGDVLRMELSMIEDAMEPNGIIVFHDYNSQFTDVTRAYDFLIATGKYDQIHINWDEIIAYVRENDLEKGNLSWHHTELEFPTFLGALKRKPY